MVIHHSEQGFVSLRQIVLAKTGLSRLHFPYYQRPITVMFDPEAASNGVKFALLEGQLLAHEIDRATFVTRAAQQLRILGEAPWT